MKTCKNCGLSIIWEGMMITVSGGFICHPDCGTGGQPVPVPANDPPPSLKANKVEKSA